MHLIDLLRSIVTQNYNSPEALELATGASPILNGKELQELSDEKKLVFVTHVCYQFDKFMEDQIHDTINQDSDWLRHWNMLKKSNFKPKLWNQFQDIQSLSETLLVEYFNSILSQYQSDAAIQNQN